MVLDSIAYRLIVLFLECRYNEIINKIDETVEAVKKKYTVDVISKEMINDNALGRLTGMGCWNDLELRDAAVGHYLKKRYHWIQCWDSDNGGTAHEGFGNGTFVATCSGFKLIIDCIRETRGPMIYFDCKNGGKFTSGCA